jgi:hypothetical protein
MWKSIVCRQSLSLWERFCLDSSFRKSASEGFSKHNSMYNSSKLINVFKFQITTACFLFKIVSSVPSVWQLNSVAVKQCCYLDSMKKEFIGLTAVHFNSVLGCGILSAFSGLSSINWGGCLPFLEATQHIWLYS